MLDAMNQDLASCPGLNPLASIHVDGLMTTNSLLLEFQADILGIEVGEWQWVK